MNKNIIINQLAVKAQNGGTTEFEDLYRALEPQFNNIIEHYFFKSSLKGFTFDKADYISAIGQAIWDSLKGFDVNKGDFLGRVIIFSRHRMKSVTDYNLAGKRFDKTKQTYSIEELYESDEFDIASPEENGLESLLKQFIKKDKDGEIIKILWVVSDSKTRHEALAKLFGGQYAAKERKRVQRVRERLQKFLQINCIYV